VYVQDLHEKREKKKIVFRKIYCIFQIFSLISRRFTISEAKHVDNRILKYAAVV